jgi:short-subunit dehydrogenase
MEQLNILITGAGKGIGFETTKKLVQLNMNVIAVSRNVEQLQALANTYPTLTIVQADICEKNDRDKILQVCQKYNCLDVLINNAGYLLNKKIEDYSEQDIIHIYNVNFFSSVFLLQSLLPILKKSTQAHVVSIGSMGGVQSSLKFPGLSIYSSAKAALSVFSECMAEECKEKNIRFNVLALGAVNTEMLKQAFPDYKASVNPQEMGVFIADFVTKDSKLFNGKIISVSNSTP